MNVDVLRLADRWIGIPLCWCLTVVRGVLSPFRGRSLPKPRNVLIVKLSEMGSTVLAYPALAELGRRIPDVRVFYLVFEENSAIFDELRLAPPEHTITVRTDSAWGTIVSGLAALRRLRRENIDTVLDMDLFSRFSAVLSFLVCRGNRVGFDRFTGEGLYRGRLLTHPVHYSPFIHTAAAFMALVKALFEAPGRELMLKQAIGEEELVLPPYEPAAAAVASVREKLRKSGGSGRLVLVNPNSSGLFPLRKWPLERFAEYCRRLLEARPDVRIVITGSKSERAEAEGMVRSVGNVRCVSFAGDTTFPELMALYSLAAMMVTNDSGPAHFAAMPRLPTLVLFGPETPALYKPIGGKARAIYAGLACSPCVSVYNNKKSPCTDNVCMKAIPVNTVLSETLALLDER